MERKEIYTLKEVMLKMPDYGNDKRSESTRKKDISYNVLFGEDIINMGSLRYQTFKNSAVCSECGLKGSFFAKERADAGSQSNPDGRYHLNLYGLNEQGKEVLMTKDHIVPKSRGGKDIIGNMQTMCCDCNLKKGNKMPPKKNDEDISLTVLQNTKSKCGEKTQIKDNQEKTCRQELEELKKKYLKTVKSRDALNTKNVKLQQENRRLYAKINELLNN